MTNKTQEIFRNIVLEKTVCGLDSTGYFNLSERIESVLYGIEEFSKNKNLTPIEQIMHCILLWVEEELSKEYGCCSECGPIIFCVPQLKIGEYKADFEISFRSNGPNEKYIIECDGHEFHEKTKEQAKHDKQRDRFLVSKGYKVLRFSGSEIYNDYRKIKEELFSTFNNDYINYINSLWGCYAKEIQTSNFSSNY